MIKFLMCCVLVSIVSLVMSHYMDGLYGLNFDKTFFSTVFWGIMYYMEKTKGDINECTKKP